MSRELPKERLATTDETGHRVYLYPAAVKGFFATRRLWVQWGLILFFLFLPWLQIHGQQAFFLDLAHRKFHLFGLILWAHDVPILFFLLMGFLLAIAWLTAVYGRVWCGWACPQTVFIERLFRQIEKWVEGDHLTRKRMDAAPMTSDKLIRKFVKWSAFVATTGIITHSFLAYFVGTGALSVMIRSNPADNPTAFLFILFSSGILLFNFGWFREQFCIIACPYGRFQSVIMDRNSLAIVYDAKRGEPRGKSTLEKPAGDCIDCFKCVQSCPTGVDIRRGIQMECIACTACADACDEVMTRLNRPQGLIRYDSEEQIESGSKAGKNPKSIRSYLYAAGVVLMLGGLMVSLFLRIPMRNSFLRAHDVPYEVVPRGSGTILRNHYQWVIQNQTGEDLTPEIQVANGPATVGAPIQLIDPFHGKSVGPGKSDTRPLFIEVDPKLVPFGKLGLEVVILGKSSNGKVLTEAHETVLVLGPFTSQVK